MQASDFDHRCTEPTCCVYGQPTTTSCLCHKSREDMMLAALVAEKRAREEAEAAVAFIADEGTYADSYGVPGSDFGVCRFCEAGGAPGIPFEHNKTCPILRCGEVSAEWVADREEERAALEAAETHSAALARALEEAKKALKPFAHAAEYLEAETEGFVDDDPLTLTYRNEEACATDIGTVLQFGHFRRARSLLAPKEDTNA